MDRLIAKAKAEMVGAVEGVRKELAKFRTGRASPGMVEGIKVEYYGTTLPINQMATIQVLENRLIGITPWDKSALKAIEKGIMTSDLGLMPTNDGHIIRLEIPLLTEERREELSKQVGQHVEQGRVQIRNLRRQANEGIDKMEKAEGLSEDEVRAGKREMQEITDEQIEELDEIAEEKMGEIMAV